MVRKERVEIQYDDHCPHCDHKFTEKGYPRPDWSKLPDDEDARQAVLDSGDYDEVCPKCGGIVDQIEESDEEFEKRVAEYDSWGGDFSDKLRARRETKRRRIATREKMAASSGLTADDIRAILAEHGHPEMTVGAGSAMTLHGLRDNTGDIDASIADDLFEELRVKHGNPPTREYHGTELFRIPGTPIDLHRDDSDRGKPMDGVNALVLDPEQLREFYLNLDRSKDQRWIRLLQDRHKEESERALLEKLEQAVGKKASDDGEATRTELLRKGSCCGRGCENCPYDPRHVKGTRRVEEREESRPVGLPEDWNDKEAAGSPSKAEIAKAMTAARLPRDVQFFVGGGKATACYGDWHEEEIVDAGNACGRKLFGKGWEDPDDSEIGSPEWTKMTVSSDTKGEDVLHDCRHNHCPDCGRVTNFCEDSTDGKHEPKEVTHKPCYACRHVKGAAGKEDPWEPWVAFDLDGTLAMTMDPFDPGKVGKPIPKMMKVLRRHLDAGDKVKILTARAAGGSDVSAVKSWLKENDLPDLDVTCEKDPGCTKIYDDLAVSVKTDEGSTKEASVDTRGQNEMFEKASPAMQKWLADVMGVGPLAEPRKPSYRECPKCGEKKARVKETGADTGMDEMELYCDGCKRYSDLGPPAKSAAGKKTAIVIKGNPKFIEGNPEADRFYEGVRKILEDNGFAVSFDPGEPYTQPQPADLWVGHSRGVDRLRFAPDGTRTLTADDFQAQQDYVKDPVPGASHYEITPGLIEALKTAAAPFEEYYKVENAAFDRAVAKMEEGPDKDMAKKGHGSRYGSCGHKIGSCRCRHGASMKIRLDVPCKRCAKEKEASVRAPEDWIIPQSQAPGPAMDLLVNQMRLNTTEDGSTFEVSPETLVSDLLKNDELGHLEVLGALGEAGYEGDSIPEDLTVGDLNALLDSGAQVKEAALSDDKALEIFRAQEATDRTPSEGQREAGNYRKGRVRLRGLEVAIENPVGSIREGVGPGGKKWRTVMARSYGYFTGSRAIDNDPVDVFIGDDPEEGRIWVIDQVDKDGAYDEPKVILGMPDEASARKAYLDNYEEGWQGLGAITEMSEENFKKWLSDKPCGAVALGKKKAAMSVSALLKAAETSAERTNRLLAESNQDTRGWWERQGGLKGLATTALKDFNPLRIGAQLTGGPAILKGLGWVADKGWGAVADRKYWWDKIVTGDADPADRVSDQYRHTDQTWTPDKNSWLAKGLHTFGGDTNLPIHHANAWNILTGTKMREDPNVTRANLRAQERVKQIQAMGNAPTGGGRQQANNTMSTMGPSFDRTPDDAWGGKTASYASDLNAFLPSNPSGFSRAAGYARTLPYQPGNNLSGARGLGAFLTWEPAAAATLARLGIDTLRNPGGAETFKGSLGNAARGAMDAGLGTDWGTNFFSESEGKLAPLGRIFDSTVGSLGNILRYALTGKTPEARR